jgi:ParB family chromosome partitioning protein
MRISAIKITDRHRRDLGDVDALANSIATVGLLHPIVIDAGDTLIAGERRLEACRRLGWKEVAVTVASEIDGIMKALFAERDENTCREPFTPSEAAALAEALEPYEKKAAKQRQEEHGGTAPGKKNTVENFTTVKARAADKVAEAVGMSRPTLEKAKAVTVAAREHPEHYEDIREEMDETGKVDPAYRKLAARQEEPERPKVKLPRAVPTWEWSKAIQTTYELFGVVTKRGGIESLIKTWEPAETGDYLKILKDIRGRCEEYIPKIERSLSCKKS